MDEKFRLVYSMFYSLNFIELFEINPERLSKFIFVIQETYNWRGNPYHNWDHAFTGFFFLFFYCLISFFHKKKKKKKKKKLFFIKKKKSGSLNGNLSQRFKNPFEAANSD